MPAAAIKRLNVGTKTSKLARLQRHNPIEEGPVLRHGALGEMQSIYLRDPDGNLAGNFLEFLVMIIAF